MTSVKAKRVMILFAPGPTWTSGDVRDQPRWDEHAEWVDDKIARGIMVLGGPFPETRGSLVIWENVTVDEARELVQSDPFVEDGVFVVEDVRAWDVFVDELA